MCTEKKTLACDLEGIQNVFQSRFNIMYSRFYSGSNYATNKINEIERSFFLCLYFYR